MSKTEASSQFVFEILEMWEANSSKNFLTLNTIEKEQMQCLKNIKDTIANAQNR